MCGINGIAYSSNSNRQTDKSILQKMSDVSDQRRPDDFGSNYQKRHDDIDAILENKNWAKSVAE